MNFGLWFHICKFLLADVSFFLEEKISYFSEFKVKQISLQDVTINSGPPELNNTDSLLLMKPDSLNQLI